MAFRNEAALTDISSHIEEIYQVSISTATTISAIKILCSIRSSEKLLDKVKAWQQDP